METGELDEEERDFLLSDDPVEREQDPLEVLPLEQPLGSMTTEELAEEIDARNND